MAVHLNELLIAAAPGCLYSEEAEQVTIGSVLSGEAQFYEVQLGIEDFHMGSHQCIWEALQKLDAERLPTNDAGLVFEKLGGIQVGDGDRDGKAYLLHLPNRARPTGKPTLRSSATAPPGAS